MFWMQSHSYIFSFCDYATGLLASIYPCMHVCSLADKLYSSRTVTKVYLELNLVESDQMPQFKLKRRAVTDQDCNVKVKAEQSAGSA